MRKDSDDDLLTALKLGVSSGRIDTAFLDPGEPGDPDPFLEEERETIPEYGSW